MHDYYEDKLQAYLMTFPDFEFARHPLCDSLVRPRTSFVTRLRSGWSHVRALNEELSITRACADSDMRQW